MEDDKIDMAVYRPIPKCSICGEDYNAIYEDRGKYFVGDTFLKWDVENHKCKSNEGSPLSRYEERLENLVDTIRVISTIDAIVLLKNYVQKFPFEE